jgi:hypothetical protein
LQKIRPGCRRLRRIPRKMKKFTIPVITLIMTLGIAAVAYSYGDPCCGKDGKAMSCARSKGDSCPMKKKDTPENKAASCCDKCDCCKGDSCPMKKKDAHKPPSPATRKDGEHADHACACCAAKKHTEIVAVSDLDLH